MRTIPPPGFTLVELLAVIAILCILTTVGVSTLSAPQSSKSINRAGSTLFDLAHLARQNALSRNTLTYLQVAEVSDGGIARTAAGIWEQADPAAVQVERWNLLPETAIATNTSVAPLNLSTGGLSTTFRGAAPLSIIGTYAFFPDGRMVGDPGVSTGIPKLKVQPRIGSPANYYELVFNPVTGTCKVNRP